MGLVLRVGPSFFLDPTLNTSRKRHLQKVLSCGHPCHTWDLGLGTLCEVVSPNSFINICENHVMYWYATISMVIEQIISMPFKIGCACLLIWENRIAHDLYCFETPVSVYV